MWRRSMWEDKLAYDLEKSGFEGENVESLKCLTWRPDQILYARNHTPTIHVLRRGGEQVLGGFQWLP